MKKIFISLFVVVCLVSFASTPAFAGDKQRHRWEGVAIGVGAAILGHAILSSARDDGAARVTVSHRDYRDRHHRDRCSRAPRHSRGHWVVQKTWVPPICERTWNPGHYTRHGRWVPGRWITIEKRPGYWVEKKVWRSRR
ncbi:MAG: hypothetical protein KGY56_10835 [Desulfobacterales bacterium]|nr:hypothetical protein [Desulfobacterales bacterium]